MDSLYKESHLSSLNKTSHLIPCFIDFYIMFSNMNYSYWLIILLSSDEWNASNKDTTSVNAPPFQDFVLFAYILCLLKINMHTYNSYINLYS